jgi:serine phosphatase RsbU (regulator of sigma subunit)
MDMSLVIIDNQKQQLEFAGAKNPLVYIQSGELHKIKGDKFPIGGNWHRVENGERLFTNHLIDLSIPTSIYLFSDGYQDQFGGPDRQKFKSKKLFELMLDIHQKPMSEQKTILADTLQQWKTEGEESQLDDILVMGVRL